MAMKCETNLLQDWTEFNRFLKLIRENGIKSFLEIGSKHGGSFWRISNVLPRGSRVVSVDLPHGDASFKLSQPNLEQCAAELRRLGYDAHLILGDSTDAAVIERVRGLGPFDLIFVDANHTEPYVWKDWNNYGPMARRIIAFHDIGWPEHYVRPPHKMPIEVSKVWNRIKKEGRHVEIRNCRDTNGIGVLWREIDARGRPQLAPLPL